jgi:hypothetical protein
VLVIDPVDEDLDLATLAIEDGGVFDAATRTIQWVDPVVPPATPRAVRFAANLRADAEPATRVRNVATIVFPDAVPPTRIDTNFVEHLVADPNEPIVADLRVTGCSETAPGSGVWDVDLVNEGLGFAYDVTATIDAPPTAVAVNDASARFAHPDDRDPNTFATVIPSAVTTSFDGVRFTTATPADPCGALRWRIRWSNLRGDAGQNGERDVAADATHVYTLICRNADGTTDVSNEATAVTGGTGVIPPPLPPKPTTGIACGLLGVAALVPAAWAALRRRRRSPSQSAPSTAR